MVLVDILRAVQHFLKIFDRRELCSIEFAVIL